MATTTAFGSLAAPDDTMEMSSPAVRNVDDDIDIDFEDYQGGVQLIDDERMHEDGDPTRPATATDDMMEDDLLPGEQAQIEEESMRDDASQVQEVQQPEDEELIDYGEDDFQEQLVEDTLIAPVEATAEVDEIGLVQLREDTSTVVENVPVEIPGIPLQDDVPAAAEQLEEPTAAADDFLASEAHHEDGAVPEEGSTVVDEPETHQIAEEQAIESHTEQLFHADDHLQFPPPLDTAVSTSTDTPGTPTDTGLHPMTIRYGDKFLPLFKSKRQPHGLLKDDNLASVSLAELMKQCRQRLALKIGQNVSEDQELVLSFEHMGLILVEDCRDAFKSSLHDVLEVYLQLHENDGAEDVPPLALNLTTQLKFQSSFAILKHAAAGGQGMSSFNFLHSTLHEQQDFYQEEYDTGDSRPHGEHDAEDGFEGHHYGESAYGDEARPDPEAQYQDQYENTGDQGEEGYAEYYQEGEYQEHTGEEEFYIPEQDEAAARLDELEADQAYQEEPPDNALETQGIDADELRAAERKAASTASSTTAQGDSANNSAGEYDDEIIDWEDDSLTTTLPEHDADAHQDFSTFLTEYEDEAAKDGVLEGDATDAQGHSGLDENKASRLPNDKPLAAADFQTDLTGQAQGDEAQTSDHGYEAGEQEGDYTHDQADNYDEQHELYHPDYQPGEEDDHYHTAQDFLNADQYEHGPEHDVYGGDENGLDDTVGTVIHHETAEDQEYEDQDDFGDEIGFDEEDGGDLQNGGTAAISGSPTGKRSFDELEEFDDDDDREIKKARAS